MNVKINVENVTRHRRNNFLNLVCVRLKNNLVDIIKYAHSLAAAASLIIFVNT